MNSHTSPRILHSLRCGFAALAACAALLFTALPVRSALVGYWNFDEASGTTAADTSGRVGPLNGTLSASGAGAVIPARVAGRFGNALDFNQGTAISAGGLVTVPTHGDLKLSNSFTISFWWRPDYAPAASTFPGIVRIGNQTTVPAAGWGYYRSQPNIPVHKRGNHQPTTYSAMTVGNWHHIALTHDGAGNNIAFQNGVMVNFVTNWPGINTTAALEFGRMDSFDNAGMDDVALFNETISLAKTRSLYTVPNNLALNYDLAKMRSLWAIFDAGSGSSGVVDGTLWNYTNSFPGSTTLGDAYISGTRWFVVLGSGVGVSAAATLLGDISPAGVGAPGTLTYTDTPTIGASARFIFDLGSTTTIGGGVNDLIEISGNLNPVGNTIVVNPLAPLANGTYRLINYTGTKSGSFNATIVHNSRYTITLDEATPGQINVSVSGGFSDVHWFSASSGAWDLSTFNWSNTLAVAADRFFQADSVTFNDAAAFQTNISISAPVFPSAMTVSSATRNYTISGSPIGGLVSGLTKQGASLLTLGSANTFRGPVNIDAGTLRVGASAALGATNGGTTVSSGATLDLNGFALPGEAVSVSGPGQSSTGAVVNTGAGLANTGLTGPVTLTGDTTFGGVNRWDVFGGTFAGNGYKLTKSGAPEIALSNLRDTGLGDIEVQRGQLTILGSTTMGNPAKTVTVRSNAVLAHWASGTNLHNKPLIMEWARLGNGTSPVGDVATNVAGVSLTGSNIFDGGSSLALLGEVSGASAVIKNGAGTLHLGGTNIYTGNTFINAGTLALVGEGTIATTPFISLASGARLRAANRVDGTLTLASGQSLIGAGSVDGHLAAGMGASVTPGFSAGTLTVTNALNLTGGATLTYELNSVTTEGGGVNDLINVGGALNLSGTTTLKLIPLASLAATPYTLINYTGTLSGGAANLNPVSDSRYSFTVDTATAPGKVQVTAVGAPQFLEWVGGEPAAETLWDLKTTANWIGAAQEQFFTGDTVVFNDFGSVFNVSLIGELYPAESRVEADASDYVFSGPGRLRGGSLTKNFSGKLTLANAGLNDYPGATVISGGTLEVGNGGTAGNLGPGPITNNATLSLNRSDDLAFANAMFGSGTLRKEGAGLLTAGLSLTNFDGPIVVSGGTLRPTVTNGVGTAVGGTAVNSGGTLDLNALNLSMESITAAGAGVGGAGAIVNSSATGQNQAFRFVTLSGDATLGGVGRWDLRNPGAGASLTGNGFTLTKTGLNQVSLVNLGETDLGDINVLQGLLSVEVGTTLGRPANTATIANGATLMIWGATVVHNKPLAIQDGGRLFKDNGNSTNLGPTTLVSGSNAVEVANNTGAELTLAGAVGGLGRLAKLGAGNLNLIAGNNYSGGTLISAGVLQVGDGGVTGSILGGVETFGVYSIRRSDTVTLANNVTGPGGMYVRTTNGLILDGTAQINVGGSVEVGQTVYGKMIVKAGASPVVGRLLLGNIASTPGDVIQEGGNVYVTNEVRIGHWPTETSLYLLGGGTLNITNPPLGVVNQNAVAEQNGILYLGIDGTGIFTQTGGVATAHGVVMDGRGNTAGTDTFNLEGGVFNVGASGFKSGNLDANATYLINLGGGTIASSANWTSVLSMTLTGTNGNVTFDLGGTVRLTGALSGPAGLRKAGAGTLILTGTNTYLGTTLVDNGTLMGTGSITGPLVVAATGTLAPGLSIGTLAVSNTVTLAGTTVMEINKTGVVRTSDFLRGVTTLTYGGALTLVATGDTLADGDTFTLFNATRYAGGFTGATLPPLGPGLVWDLTALAINGTVRVTDNLPPVAGSYSLSTTRNHAVGVSTLKLAERSTDPENDPLSVISVSASTNGAVVGLAGNVITYTPVAGFVGADLFRYLITDGQGGLDLGDVEVLIYPGDQIGVNIVSLVLVNGNFNFTFAGIPGRVYGIERAAAVNGPWTQIATATCDADGLTTFIDTNSPMGSAFYRTVYPAAP